MDLRNAIRTRRLYLDGGMGSSLQAAGLPPGRLPELWNLERPDIVRSLHRRYLAAGCRLISTNTFGCHRDKLARYGLTPAAVIPAAVGLVRRAMEEEGVSDGFICGDLGPTGKLLKPWGELDFAHAVAAYAGPIRALARAGADAILFETMGDLYELKAAVVAAKETCGLPVFATLMFDAGGRLLTGGTPREAVALLEGLGVEAIGINCGSGPAAMLPAAETMAAYASVPLIFQPNAGLPQNRDGQAVYDLSPADFAGQMGRLAELGTLLGGCCGTTPEHLAALIRATRNIPLPKPEQKETLLISSYSRSAELDGGTPVVIGERLNPTGKKKLQAALRAGDMDYLLEEACRQERDGAQLLDLNVGLPELDEVKTLTEAMEAVQQETDLPLCLDTADPAALAAALRRYNGKPLLNSVQAGEASMAAVFPLVKKYGGAVICLTMDENGVPPDAEGRVALARKLVRRAEAMGIPRRELLIDVLTTPVSTGGDEPRITLEALRRVKTELGVKTVLGISNVSFGLPQRSWLNESFFTQALAAGLDAAILNPGQPGMMGAWRAWLALSGKDPGCGDYLRAYGGSEEEPPDTLRAAVTRGREGAAVRLAEARAKAGEDPLALIRQDILPALDRVGRGFEAGTLFLPQLRLSAAAAQGAFAALGAFMPGKAEAGPPEVALATVRGDIHDIGKNLVKLLLESFGFRVLDLGTDAAPEMVAAAVREQNIPLVGLSALMTTTTPAMAETVALLRDLPCRVMVGGAVVTAEYAKRIGADRYTPDAMSAVRYARQVLGRKGEAGERAE